MTTQEGIKQIKENMSLILEWKKIEELIPSSFAKSNKFKKTGLAAIFCASLELEKDGVINMMQKKLFDDILIRSAKHTPLKLRQNNWFMNNDKKKDNIINFPKKKSKLEREVEAIIF